MALSPGTLLPQLPLHGMHMSQASLISPSHVSLHAVSASNECMLRVRAMLRIVLNMTHAALPVFRIKRLW